MKLLTDGKKKPDLLDWIESKYFFYNKQNIRPWGSYELLVSKDGNQWISFNRAFGWGYTENMALELVLKNEFKDGKINEQLRAWLGEEYTTQILELISNVP